MRGLIILLIMVIFFLSGFVFGIQKDEQASTVETTETTPAVEETTETVSSQPSMEQANVYEIEEGQYSLTNKTASVLEATVKKVFDIIVGIMYEISKIFF
ncbi:hypothetical protein [Oceanobacillus kimchii]|uniref:hypothetical protein n=1 Tax=Oceanobacillus kimchii TaxID=746691 RepID=UPI003C70E9CF